MPTLASGVKTAAGAAPLNVQSQADFKANWDRQAPCPGQYAPEVSASVWSELLKSDPVGATWGPGVRRAPNVPSWGFNAKTAPQLTVPFLMVSGENDKQVAPERVRQLYAAVGSPRKVFIDLACSSHNAMWEKNHLLLFKASLEWLEQGTVQGQSQGMLRLGY
jgi:alpha-beta hydrolase superfamily lysophospholipase